MRWPDRHSLLTRIFLHRGKKGYRQAPDHAEIPLLRQNPAGDLGGGILYPGVFWLSSLSQARRRGGFFGRRGEQQWWVLPLRAADRRLG